MADWGLGERANQSLPLLLEVSEVARQLGIGRTMAYQLVARQEIPTVRIGRCIRVPRDELRAWISTRTLVPPGTRADAK